MSQFFIPSSSSLFTSSTPFLILPKWFRLSDHHVPLLILTLKPPQVSGESYRSGMRSCRFCKTYSSGREQGRLFCHGNLCVLAWLCALPIPLIAQVCVLFPRKGIFTFLPTTIARVVVQASEHPRGMWIGVGEMPCTFNLPKIVVHIKNAFCDVMLHRNHYRSDNSPQDLYPWSQTAKKKTSANG
jgi:hypothetical protein